MKLLRASHGGRTLTVQVPPGTTLQAALAPTELQVRTGCNGNGSCGLCRVRIQSGLVSKPSAAERLNLSPALLEAGVRLACQTLALGGVDLEVESLAPATLWRELPLDHLTEAQPPPGPAPGDPAALRIALDVGTTNLNLTVWDAQGTRLAALRGPNPQAGFGSDVIARLQAADAPGAARQLAEAVPAAVLGALRPWADRPGQIVAVGNTAMLALLEGTQEGLLDPANWGSTAPRPRAATQPSLRWTRSAGSDYPVTLIPPLGGFIGSDLLAAVLAAGLLEGRAPALLLDFGTNTEIALWDGATLWVTSAAGGPAFEACGLRCAVPAEDGAIARVRPGTPLGYEVLGGGEPKGVCGTGLVDWIACLLDLGQLNRLGQFQNLAAAPALGPPAHGIILDKRDVDLFQRAKAAIQAAIQVLLGQAGLATPDLGRIVTTGLFGRGLDIGNAQRVGLLPRAPGAQVETCANLALAGCEELLRPGGGPRLLDPLRARARLINLAQCPEFEDLFLDGLFLGPAEGP